MFLMNLGRRLGEEKVFKPTRPTVLVLARENVVRVKIFFWVLGFCLFLEIVGDFPLFLLHFWNHPDF